MDPNSFQNLAVWKKSSDLVVEIYALSKSLPTEEKFGICSQLQRAAVSIPCNIAEGHGRRSTGDFARFLTIALGSCREVQTLLIICKNLEFIASIESISGSYEEIAKMLSSLIKRVRDQKS